MTFFDRPSTRSRGKPAPESSHSVSTDLGELISYLVISDNRPGDKLRDVAMSGPQIGLGSSAPDVTSDRHQ